MNKGYGVMGSDFDERSQRDIQLQANFNCRLPTVPIQYVSGAPIGVLGSGNEERSQKDIQLQNTFSCGIKETYALPNRMMIEPRSVKDQLLLTEFNHCNQVESYSACPWARITDNPYNSSSKVMFVPMQ